MLLSLGLTDAYENALEDLLDKDQDKFGVFVRNYAQKLMAWYFEKDMAATAEMVGETFNIRLNSYPLKSYVSYLASQENVMSHNLCVRVLAVQLDRLNWIVKFETKEKAFEIYQKKNTTVRRIKFGPQKFRTKIEICNFSVEIFGSKIIDGFEIFGQKHSNKIFFPKFDMVKSCF